ncbi:periplasmic heavy metal sensor [Mesorhizobium sp. PAMC28654]|uniref:periplasmic heavy metal sensor n=1 Tax=Mesorhizobium sp. PAMC28654 TaxID=2880934 RepID=UPI001D0BDDB2|nr:periplasmic heavy metal sensor [Mesorhizobium sp. PAMC28654]UDL89284.1 periplasmic heavy metal sensor [Mesorhizobium sp. PAMC28654]
MSPRSRTILIAASLAFNVFFVGAAGGALIWYSFGHNRLAQPGQGLRFAAQHLSAQQQKTFRQMLNQARQDAAADVEAARNGRAALSTLLAADTIDQPAVNTQLEVVRKADINVRTAVEKAVLDFAQKLTPEERRIFVQDLRGRGAMLRGAAQRKTQ